MRIYFFLNYFNKQCAQFIAARQRKKRYLTRTCSKGLKRENLRDHMNDLELIFTMLGEASTTEIAQKTDARGLNQNKTAARKGGKIAGSARKQLEAETGKRVISIKNFLELENRKTI